MGGMNRRRHRSCGRGTNSRRRTCDALDWRRHPTPLVEPPDALSRPRPIRRHRRSSGGVLLHPTALTPTFPPPTWGRCRAQRGGGGSGARTARELPPPVCSASLRQTTSPTLGEEKRVRIRKNSSDPRRLPCARRWLTLRGRARRADRLCTSHTALGLHEQGRSRVRPAAGADRRRASGPRFSRRAPSAPRAPARASVSHGIAIGACEDDCREPSERRRGDALARSGVPARETRRGLRSPAQPITGSSELRV